LNSCNLITIRGSKKNNSCCKFPLFPHSL
jgi:hypothetical protein